MFKQKKIEKENYMKYFFGGTAAGMAAGLLAGKLICNTFTKKLKKSSPTKSEIINKKINKYSQDDNIHNPYFDDTKNTSSYKNGSEVEYLISAITLNKCDNDMKNTINNFDLEHKYDKNMQKIFHDKSYRTLHNISLEDNARYNLSNRIISENNEKEKNKEYEDSEIANMKELSNSVQSNMNLEDGNLLKATKAESMNNFYEEDTLKSIKSEENIKLAETLDSLSINFDENNTTFKNLPIIKNASNNSSNNATYNDTYFDNDEEISNSSAEEFYENDIISSTKRE